jgi:cyclopropane-fatty-acyl-phospholipid synthase
LEPGGHLGRFIGYWNGHPFGTLSETPFASPPGSTMADDSAKARSLDMLRQLSAGYDRDFAIRFWDGTTDFPGAGQPLRFTLVLQHPGAVRAMFWPFSDLSFGEAYIFDDFDLEGDTFAFVAWLRHLVSRIEALTLGEQLRLLATMLRLPNRQAARNAALAGKPRVAGQGIEADRRGISLHYDRPSAFYRLFLGPTMQYSCGYFHTAADDLDDAQRRKMDYICRKLRLQAGQHLLDIGCGCGGLLRHAVTNFGVTGVGVTLAGEQAKWAEQANGEAGLDDKIQILFCDYREMKFDAEFDAVASVGMTEEVGLTNLPCYFDGVARALKPGGSYLHHAINLRWNTPFPRWTTFARKYVFPNGRLQTLADVQAAGNAVGLEVRDVENLREHYALTLRAWVRRLEANRAEAERLTDPVTYRIYRLYMAGATMGFDAGIYQLNQTLFVKPQAGGVAGLPLTRAAWYGRALD